MGVGWVANAKPQLLYPREETWYPSLKRLGGHQGWSGPAWKLSPPPRFDPRTVQPIASRHTYPLYAYPCMPGCLYVYVYVCVCVCVYIYIYIYIYIVSTHAGRRIRDTYHHVRLTHNVYVHFP